MKEDEEEGEGHPSASAKCSISVISDTNAVYPRLHIFNFYIDYLYSTEIGKQARLFAKLQPGRARKRINAT